MPKENQMKILCLCCKEQTGKEKLKQVSSLFPFNGFMILSDRDYLTSFMTIVGKYPEFYQWACDDCINGGKAILANPEKQYFTFTHPMYTANPYLSYFDKGFTCKNCNDKFTFSKEEQKYWYEELSFVVYSKPIACGKCRKEGRVVKNLNKELSELLQEGEPEEKSTLIRISEIYKEMGKTEKMKKYLTAANKR